MNDLYKQMVDEYIDMNVKWVLFWYFLPFTIIGATAASE